MTTAEDWPKTSILHRGSAKPRAQVCLSSVVDYWCSPHPHQAGKKSVTDRLTRFGHFQFIHYAGAILMWANWFTTCKAHSSLLSLWTLLTTHLQHFISDWWRIEVVKQIMINTGWNPILGSLSGDISSRSSLKSSNGASDMRQDFI